jgi:hypothetical protein
LNPIPKIAISQRSALVPAPWWDGRFRAAPHLNQNLLRLRAKAGRNPNFI